MSNILLSLSLERSNLSRESSFVGDERSERTEDCIVLRGAGLGGGFAGLIDEILSTRKVSILSVPVSKSYGAGGNLEETRWNLEDIDVLRE